MHIRHTPALLALLCAMPGAPVLAQQDAPKAIIAVMGDADRFNIGQDGFCGKREEIDSPSGKNFRIPANKKSFFYIQSRLHGSMMTYTCEGDFSFIPEPGMLHIIRYSMEENHCKLEMFESIPGDQPQRTAVEWEAGRNCLLK